MGSKRDQVKERFWREIIGRFRATSLTDAQFCKQEQLDIKHFRYWRKTLVQRDEERRVVESPKDEIADKMFLPVVVTEQKTDRRLPGTQQIAVAEIVVAGGSIQLFNGITIDTVRAVWEGVK